MPYAADRFGFAWADTRTLPAEALTDAVLARVQQLVRDGEPRALLWVHYFDPHEPYEPHRLAADAPPEARYDAEVAAVDAALARLVNGLTILQRPSLLVITGDHGEEFGEHGGAYHGSSLYDEQLRVPLVVAARGRALFSGSTIAAPVSLVDVAPTVAALVGLPPLAGDGTLLPPLDDEPREVLAALPSRRMLLRFPWKLIHDPRRDVDELYDLEADPAEQRNLVDARAAVADELRLALAHWWNQSPPSLLAATLGDRGRTAAERSTAARELGEREVFTAAGALAAALDDDDGEVRAEAALALGQLSDARAGAALRRLINDDRFGDRAALMLGRLRDRTAAPRLAAICRRPPAAGDATTAAIVRDAAHYLGFVGDRAAVAALTAAAADPRARGAAYVALGRLAGRDRDPAAAAALRARFAVEERADARADLAWALGLAGDSRAIAALAAAAAGSASLPRASEALVRLGAVPAATAVATARAVGKDQAATAPFVGGLDFACRRSSRRALDADLDEWLGATSCTVEATTAAWRALAPAGADVVLLRARAHGDAARLTVVVDGAPLPSLTLGPHWREIRMVKPISPMVKPIRIELRRDGAAVELDHILLLRDVTPAPL
jgi:HEAT repeat protein